MLCTTLFAPPISNLLSPLCSASFSLVHSLLLQYSLIIPLISAASNTLFLLLNYDCSAHARICNACLERLSLLSSVLSFAPLDVLISLKITYRQDKSKLLLTFTIRYKLSIISTYILAITVMICRSLAESTGHFWWPSEFKNVANPYLENLKHSQNP